MGSTRVSTASVAGSAVVDVVAVLLFALIGRVSHDGGPLGFVGTAGPFLVGLAVGWVVMRAWRLPGRIIWTGIGVWVATVAGGMLLRVATGQGTQVAFILVATATLGVLLLGWRGAGLLIARALRERPSRGR